jgi:hypothetical protein
MRLKFRIVQTRNTCFAAQEFVGWRRLDDNRACQHGAYEALSRALAAWPLAIVTIDGTLQQRPFFDGSILTKRSYLLYYTGYRNMIRSANGRGEG